MPFINLKDLESKEMVPGFFGQFIHSDSMTTAYWNIKAGAEFPTHSHVHEQVANAISGEFELIVDGEAQVMTPGMVAVIPSNVPHSGRAITDCLLLDVFQPRREDYE